MTPEAGCAIEECSGKVFARGWCCAHYKRWRKYGHPLARPSRRSDADRFMDSVVKSADGCWSWQQKPGSHGYGNFRHTGKQTLAHRWAYEHFVGPIPEGMQLDHLCRNRTCVNPAHLEPVTPRENFLRGKRWDFFSSSCHRGHPRVESNTYVNPTTGKHFCRECMRINDRNRSPRSKSNRKEVAA